MKKNFFNNYFDDIYYQLNNFEEKKFNNICKKLKNINKKNKIILARWW
jgi:predicted solute-binding protein